MSKDSNKGGSNAVVREVMSEEQSLLSNNQADHDDQDDQGNVDTNYRSVNDTTDSSDLKNDGYAFPKARLITFLAAMYCGTFLNAADATIVSTLLSVIASDLNQIQNMSWIATAYLLSSATFQPIYGKLSDIFGRKPILLMCAALFGIGCCISSFQSFPMVVIGRFITGMGGSGLSTVGTIAMSDIIPLRDRGLFQGLANVAYLCGAASGGILGGVINDFFGWQYVFSLQVPLSAAIGLSLYKYFELPEGSTGLGSSGHIKEKLKRVDFLGSFFLVMTLLTILLAASLGNQYFTYTSPTFFSLLGMAIMFLSLFVYVETNVSPEPILPIHLMTERTILSSSLTNLFLSMSTFSCIFYYPFYVGNVIQLPSSKVGLRIISNFLGVATGSVLAGLYMRKTGKYYKYIVVCIGLYVIGLVNFLLLTRHTPTIAQMLIMTIPGFSYALMLTVTLLSLIAAAPVKFQAGTTSIQYTFRSVGSTLGVSISSAIFQDLLRKSLNSRVPKIIDNPKQAKEIIHESLKNAEYLKVAPKIIKSTLIDCYEIGTRGTFYFCFVMAILGFISTVFIREHKLHTGLSRD